MFIITSYDGSFESYIEAFLTNLGWWLNEILRYVEGGCDLIPVGENIEEFNAFVEENNLPSELFTAYPSLTVLNILNNADLLFPTNAEH